MENMTDQDVTEMVSEAITVLSNETTEHEDVGESANYFLDWSKVLHQREDLVKELVKAIQEDTSQKEEQLREIQNGQDAKQLKEVDIQLENSKESCQMASKAVEDVRKQTEQIEQEHQRLLQLQEEEEHKTTTILPNNRKELNLYKYVTNIRWDFDAPSEEIKGVITSDKKVRTIDFNSSENSKFFITNSVWDLLESDWD